MYSSERGVRKGVMEVHTTDPLEAMAKKISTMTKKLEKLEVAAPSAEQVNYMGNQPRPPQNDPYSNTYNPGWRNDPNINWGGNQGQRSNNNVQNNNRPYQPPFQRQQQPFQQPPPPVPPQQKPSSSTPPSSIEATLEKLAQSTASFFQNTHSFMNET
ncbi:hypothetical protein PIB30_089300 [Stylosanthes scabra]|uniref:Uncharacterized protein n=1 Tax=Stylosanthes scabra TaxID=79078 RepID=A0ABU6TTK1_9FABA|nr:hypothetical protein [Stylosanthes scabra]